MTKPRKTCTIIGSDKGGVGKSMVAMLMTLVFDHSRRPLRVVEIDNQQRLTSMLGEGRVDRSLPAAPELSLISRDRHAAEAFFNPVYAEWMKGDSLTDLGANVTTSLMAWFRQCEIGELAAEDFIDFRFVACASPDDQALRSAAAAVEEAREALGPAAEYYVVLNDLSGVSGFAPYEGSEAMAALRSMEAEGKVSLLTVPFCDSILLEHGRAMGLDPLQVVHRADEVAERAGLDVVGARVHRRKMIVWLKDTQRNLEPVISTFDAADEPSVRPAAA